MSFLLRNMTFEQIILADSDTCNLYLGDIDIVPSRVPAEELKELKENTLKAFAEDNRARIVSFNKIRKISNEREFKNRKNILNLLSKIELLWSPGQNSLTRDLDYHVRSLFLKLLVHLISPYTDKEYKKMKILHRDIAIKATCLLEDKFPKIAFVVSGSFPEKERWQWHPYYSDIDLLPLQITPDVTAIDIRRAYKDIVAPNWLYVNCGGQKSVGGLFKDPVEHMYVISELKKLTNSEKEYLFNTFIKGCVYFGNNKPVLKKYLIELNKTLNGRLEKLASICAG